MHIEFEYVAIFVIAMAVFLISTFWEPRKYRRRRKSLRQDASGVWIWTELDGSEMRSDIHPGEPGGAWVNDSSSDGGFDGGDSGGGGGGGD